MVWLGIAGMLVNARGTNLFIDPLLSLVEKDGRPYNEGVLVMIVPLPIEARVIPRVDGVLYTHADYDHLGRNDCCGCRLKIPDGVIWHPGDTRLIDELLEYGTFQLPPEFPDCAAEDACAYIRDLATRYLVLNPREPLRLPAG